MPSPWFFPLVAACLMMLTETAVVRAINARIGRDAAQTAAHTSDTRTDGLCVRETEQSDSYIGGKARRSQPKR